MKNYYDINRKKVKTGDVIDIHQTVNGQNKFFIFCAFPLDIRYFNDITRKYEYDKEDLLSIDDVTEEGFEIVDSLSHLISIEDAEITPTAVKKTTYVCPICGSEYETEQEANDCINRTGEKVAEVGDIVEVRYGYGWWDGKDEWVINPDVDTSKHGFSKDRSYGFYYVVTYLEIDEGHRIRYHLATGAMTGVNGHASGYTYTSGHCAPKKIENPPVAVVEDSKRFIGKKAKGLI